MFISTFEDGYILERFETETRWVVTLEDDTKIFQDDYRPGIEPYSAWTRLKHHVESNNLIIKNMILQFRSHIIPVNNGPVDGFFFCKAVLGGLALEKTIQYYIAGTLKNDILETRKWYVPELELESAEFRDIALSQECLIKNRIN